jgi:carboxyl-terminal processing protease
MNCKSAAGRFDFLTLVLRTCGSGCLLLACATTPAPPAAEPPPPVVSDPRLVPPVFAPTPVPTPEAREDRRAAERRQIIAAVWQTVRDRHYDPTLGGVDWNAVRARYEPLAVSAPNDAAFYRILNQMVGELGQSHMLVSGPGADDDAEPDPSAGIAPDRDHEPTHRRRAPSGSLGPSGPLESPAATGATQPDLGAPLVVNGTGDPGLVVRSIEGRAVVTSVRAGSSAERKGILPGFVVLRIGGRTLTTVASSARPLRPVEERFAMRRLATRRLQGPITTRVSVDYLDNNDRPGQVVLERDAPAGPARQIGHLPPLYPETHVAIVDGIGVLGFNLFLLDPTLGEVKRAMDKFRALHVRGVILDLRGNPGGIGAMSIPVAAEFVSSPTTLGTIHFRTFTQTFTAQPSMGRTPFTGPLVILTDEGSASTSEILAGGLQEAGRARIVGEGTLGAVLPSVIEELPGGAVMQVVVADFQTPRGVLLEGRGVKPDEQVAETRAAFRARQDPILRAGLESIRAGITRNHEGTRTPRRTR